ncbi:MAG TPA: hypothetical protein DCZ30_04445 [Clostridiales bacterium]|nr:hypothetical protein [Clostridiales bacterium]
MEIKEVANRIFTGDMTWEQAVKVTGIAEKTLRNRIINLCKEDEELRKRFYKYSTTRRNKHEDINIPAVIIEMVKQERSLAQMADVLGITKESLRTLIKKEDNPILNKLLNSHSDRRKRKENMSLVQRQEVESEIEKYILENPDYIASIKLDSSSIKVEKQKVDSFLFEVEKRKSQGISEKQIAETMGVGPEYIRRARKRNEKLEMLLKEQTNENNINL